MSFLQLPLSFTGICFFPMTYTTPFNTCTNLPALLTSTFFPHYSKLSNIYFISYFYYRIFIFMQTRSRYSLYIHTRDIRGHPLMHPLPSRSLPSLLLFLLACLEFPLAVLQHGGSIWKCLLKGSRGCCSWGPYWSYFYAVAHSCIRSCKISASRKCQTC